MTIAYRLFLLLFITGAAAHADQVDQSAALDALKQANSVLIDVRTEEEHAQGALPGATRIETDNLAERIASIAPDKDAPIVLYCRSGRRSAAAQDLLQSMGYSHVINAGGYQDLQGLVSRP